MSLDAKLVPRPLGFSGLGFSATGLGGELRLPVLDRVLAHKLRELVPEASGSRAKIWELHQTFHCSIIGTCLTTGELKGLLSKLKVVPEGEASDHELHKAAVTLAGMRGIDAKLLNKTLDRKFRRQITSFAAARTADEVRTFWDRALEAGDIPGGYWAVMTHPATSEALIRHVFGEIHMLSHLVGAANRADIRRLRELETENAALLAKVERQQAVLREEVVERERRIRELQDLLSAAVTHPGGMPTSAPQFGRDDALAAVLTDTQGRLERAGRQLAHLEGRVRELDRRAATATARAADVEAELAPLRDECRALEAQLAGLIGAPANGPNAARDIDLGGATILYVGGRSSQLPHLKALIERLNGSLSHHSGGTDESTSSLPGHISRAQAVLFPVDCVSHAAMFELKRLCKQAGKPYLPLRTTSLAALLAGIEALQARLHPGAS